MTAGMSIPRVLKGLTVAEAQRATRLHNQVIPNVTKIEKPSKHQGIQVESFSQKQIQGLEAKGHKIEMIESEEPHLSCQIRC